MSYIIDDERAWRVSKSGYSIKTGWATGARMVAAYAGRETPLDPEKFQLWLDDAERICELHNATLEPLPECMNSPLIRNPGTLPR